MYIILITGISYQFLPTMHIFFTFITFLYCTRTLNCSHPDYFPDGLLQLHPRLCWIVLAGYLYWDWHERVYLHSEWLTMGHTILEQESGVDYMTLSLGSADMAIKVTSEEHQGADLYHLWQISDLKAQDWNIQAEGSTIMWSMIPNPFGASHRTC